MYTIDDLDHGLQRLFDSRVLKMASCMRTRMPSGLKATRVNPGASGSVRGQLKSESLAKCPKSEGSARGPSSYAVTSLWWTKTGHTAQADHTPATLRDCSQPGLFDYLLLIPASRESRGNRLHELLS